MDTAVRRNLWLGALAVYLATSSHGTLYILLALHLHRLQFELSWVGYTFAWLAAAQLAARFLAASVYQPERARRWFVLALVLMATAHVGFGFGSSLLGLMVLVALYGLGIGTLTTLHLAWFVDSMPTGTGTVAWLGWYSASLAAGYTTGNLMSGFVADYAGVSGAFLLFTAFPLTAIAVVGLLRVTPGSGRGHRPSYRLPTLAELRSVGPRVLMAAFVAFYISVANEMTEALFPIHAVNIGLSAGLMGTLKATRSAAATLIRVFAGVVFRWWDYRRVIAVAVVVLGATTIPMGFVLDFWPLALLLAIYGFARGILRVGSTLQAAEEQQAGGRGGLTSAVYHAGLDLGTIVGPLVGGLLSGVIGIPVTFAAVTAVMMVVYYVVQVVVARAGRADAVGRSS